MSRADQEQTFVNLANRVAQLMKEPAMPVTQQGPPVEEELIHEGVFPSREDGDGTWATCTLCFLHKPILQEDKAMGIPV